MGFMRLSDFGHYFNTGIVGTHARTAIVGHEERSVMADRSKDALAEVEKLGKLHDQGILSDDEFAAQKAKLLGS